MVAPPRLARSSADGAAPSLAAYPLFTLRVGSLTAPSAPTTRTVVAPSGSTPVTQYSPFSRNNSVSPERDASAVVLHTDVVHSKAIATKQRPRIVGKTPVVTSRDAYTSRTSCGCSSGLPRPDTSPATLAAIPRRLAGGVAWLRRARNALSWTGYALIRAPREPRCTTAARERRAEASVLAGDETRLRREREERCESATAATTVVAESATATISKAYRRPRRLRT